MLFTAVHGMFQHANIALQLGPLNWIFSMAELHRWHHSRTREEAHSNFGANLILWDVIFGTRFLPRDRTLPPDHVGFGQMEQFPAGLWGQLWAPWRRSSRRDEQAEWAEP